MSQFITVNNTTCIKSAKLNTWQHVSATTRHHQAKQNEVLVHSIFVLFMASHIFLRCIIPVVCVTNEREESVINQFDVFLTVHHIIDFSKHQLSAQFF